MGRATALLLILGLLSTDSQYTACERQLIGSLAEAFAG